MCGIFGFYKIKDVDAKKLTLALFEAARVRGRDAAGVVVFHEEGHFTLRSTSVEKLGEMIEDAYFPDSTYLVMGNVRAAPTNEWVEDLNQRQVQPYVHNGVWAVHNGTVANDREFGDFLIDSMAIPKAYYEGRFDDLIGSLATVLYDSNTQHLIFAKNFKPLHLNHTKHGGLVWCSDNSVTEICYNLDVTSKPLQFKANTVLTYPLHDLTLYQERKHTFDHFQNQNRALVICSGGLDSTVVAKVAMQENDSVTLMHFLYGCRSEAKEVEAVKAVANALGIKVEFLDLSYLKTLGGNPLTDLTMEVAGGEAGTEYANEWVPFRNGLMLSMVVAYCDRHKYDRIYLGVNLEESGAYGDNEPEFYEHMQKAIRIGSKSAPEIHNPLSNLMKHEIVKLGLDIGAPIDKSWSCYKGGEYHCGDCGPCYMRQRAFKMNGLKDKLKYLTDGGEK